MQHLIKALIFNGYAFNRVLDIGANRGDFSRTVRAYFPHAEIHAVEPNAEHSALLRDFKLHTCALSSKAGTGILYCSKIDGANSGASLFRENTYFYNDQNVAESEVILSRLDDLFEDKRFDLIKCDVQGGELDVILGGEQTFKEASLLVIELSFVEYNERGARIDEVWTKLQEIGFTPVDACEFISSGIYNKNREQMYANDLPIQMTMVFERVGARVSKNDVVWESKDRGALVAFLRELKRRDPLYRIADASEESGMWPDDIVDFTVRGHEWDEVLDHVSENGRFDYVLSDTLNKRWPLIGVRGAICQKIQNSTKESVTFWRNGLTY